MSRTNSSKSGTSLADESPFVRLLSTPGRVRILDVLLRQPGVKMTASEIADAADIDEGTFSRNKDVLQDLDLVSSEKRSRKTFYEINIDSDVVQVLARAHTELLKHGPDVVEKTEISENGYIGQIKSVGSASTSNRVELADNNPQNQMLDQILRKEEKSGEGQ